VTTLYVLGNLPGRPPIPLSNSITPATDTGAAALSCGNASRARASGKSLPALDKSNVSSTTATASPLYRIESVESAVKATIRQVTQPAVRDAMWSAWQSALADAAADSPDRMPWEREVKADVITQQSAHLAMVKVLEAITDIESRCRIRDLLALECEFIEIEGTEGIRRYCQHCGRPYRARSSQSRYCSTSHRQAAFKKRKRQAQRDRDQENSQGLRDIAQRRQQPAGTRPAGQRSESTTTECEDRADIAQEAARAAHTGIMPGRASASPKASPAESAAGRRPRPTSSPPSSPASHPPAARLRTTRRPAGRPPTRAHAPGRQDATAATTMPSRPSTGEISRPRTREPESHQERRSRLGPPHAHQRQPERGAAASQAGRAQRAATEPGRHRHLAEVGVQSAEHQRRAPGGPGQEAQTGRHGIP
jgi:hypothetical protein